MLKSENDLLCARRAADRIMTTTMQQEDYEQQQRQLFTENDICAVAAKMSDVDFISDADAIEHALIHFEEIDVAPIENNGLLSKFTLKGRRRRRETEDMYGPEGSAFLLKMPKSRRETVQAMVRTNRWASALIQTPSVYTREGDTTTAIKLLAILSAFEAVVEVRTDQSGIELLSINVLAGSETWAEGQDSYTVSKFDVAATQLADYLRKQKMSIVAYSPEIIDEIYDRPSIYTEAAALLITLTRYRVPSATYIAGAFSFSWATMSKKKKTIAKKKDYAYSFGIDITSTDAIRTKKMRSLLAQSTV